MPSGQSPESNQDGPRFTEGSGLEVVYERTKMSAYTVGEPVLERLSSLSAIAMILFSAAATAFGLGAGVLLDILINQPALTPQAKGLVAFLEGVLGLIFVLCLFFGVVTAMKGNNCIKDLKKKAAELKKAAAGKAMT